MYWYLFRSSDTPEALTAWHSINGAELNVIADTTPVSKALPNALQLKIPPGRFGLTGFGNEGFNGAKFNFAFRTFALLILSLLSCLGGLKVEKGVIYTASFFYRFPTTSSFRGNVAVGFQTSSGLTLGSTSVAISGAQTTWLQVTVTFSPVQNAFNNNNYFTIVLDSTAAAGQTIHFAMLSLFPPTFRSRVNGLRPDLATVSLALHFVNSIGLKAALGTSRNATRLFAIPWWKKSCERYFRLGRVSSFMISSCRR